MSGPLHHRDCPTVRSVLTAAGAGLVTGLALIIAIGAQNAFVLRQGLARQHVGLVVAICAVSDLVLILAGVAGIGTLVEQAAWVIEVVRWLGVAFLTWYGVSSLLRARHQAETLEAARAGVGSRRGAAVRALALTWLNPHVYLDTVLLLGSIAATHAHDLGGGGGVGGGGGGGVGGGGIGGGVGGGVGGTGPGGSGDVGGGQWWFAAGAGLASIVWFVVLGYGARLAHRRLSTPRAWQVLDVLIGLTMLGIAVMLARG